MGYQGQWHNSQPFNSGFQNMHAPRQVFRGYQGPPNPMSYCQQPMMQQTPQMQVTRQLQQSMMYQGTQGGVTPNNSFGSFVGGM